MVDVEQPSSRDRTRPPLGSLAMIWRFASRYPGRIAGALAALLVSSAATLAIPSGFRLVIDRGFMGGGDLTRWLDSLFLIVAFLRSEEGRLGKEGVSTVITRWSPLY